LSELAEELAIHFLVKDYKWKFDYGMANPDEDDIDNVIARASEILVNEDAAHAQLEIGRLLFKKLDGIIDVYVYMGRVNNEQ
jgi:hypothetical protein